MNGAQYRLLKFVEHYKKDIANTDKTPYAINDIKTFVEAAFPADIYLPNIQEDDDDAIVMIWQGEFSGVIKFEGDGLFVCYVNFKYPGQFRPDDLQGRVEDGFPPGLAKHMPKIIPFQ